MYTLKQLADETSTSKQKIYRFIKKNYADNIILRDNIMFVDETVRQEVLKVFKQTEVHQSTSNDVMMIQQLKAQIKQLEEQIKQKDIQIQASQELLKNQQVLTLQANQKIELLENKEEKEVYKKTIFNLYKKIK